MIIAKLGTVKELVSHILSSLCLFAVVINDHSSLFTHEIVGKSI